MTQMVLNTESVLNIATQIENDNSQLRDLLNNSKSTVDSLSSYWLGTASEQTREAYESFASKFFQVYYDILDQYVKFLRTNVAEQYNQTEQVNTQLADAFR